MSDKTTHKPTDERTCATCYHRQRLTADSVVCALYGESYPADMWGCPAHISDDEAMRAMDEARDI